MSLETYRTKETLCINCGAALDAATGTEAGQDAPTPGSITICLYCGHLMAFADDLSFRPLSDAEIAEVAGDKRIIEVQKARRIAFAVLRR
jgi:hypothetical protein